MLMLIVIMGIVYIITACYMKYKAMQLNNTMMRNVDSIKIKNRMLKVETEYWRLINNGVLDKYPRISKYLYQNTIALSQMGNDFELNKIIVTEAKYDTEFKKFINELRKAPPVVQELVLEKADILEQIIKLNRPYYYIYIKCKNTVTSNIARILISVLISIGRFYKRINRNEITGAESEKILNENSKIRKITTRAKYA